MPWHQVSVSTGGSAAQRNRLLREKPLRRVLSVVLPCARADDRLPGAVRDGAEAGRAYHWHWRFDDSANAVATSQSARLSDLVVGVAAVDVR